jgi:SAM-dependent methyltransferase
VNATEAGLDRCVACHGESWKPRHQGILECTKCGHVFADLDHSDDELFELYQADYFHGSEYSDYLADRRAIQKSLGRRWERLRTLIDPERHRRLFEIGCAHGFFLDLVRGRFETAAGIDVSREAVRYAREELGLDVLQGDLLKVDLGDARFDVVCMWDCIEHLREPDSYLERMSARMNPGALLALTTGDIGSLNARLRGRRWRLMHPPTHVHYFSKPTLTRMLVRYGFAVRYWRYCGSYRSLDGIVHGTLALNKGRSKLQEIMKGTALARLSCYLNLYDIMYVICEKTR